MKHRAFDSNYDLDITQMLGHMLNFMHMGKLVENNKSIKYFFIYWLICFPEMEYKVGKKGAKD